MSSIKGFPDDVFLNVRKAYRLLHDYQSMVINAMRYIESQLDIPYNGGWSRSEKDIRSGYVKLSQSSWDWLPMSSFEFHFLKPLVPEGWLSLSFFIIGDSGYIEADTSVANKADTTTFAPADKSSTKFAFILRRAHWDPFPFMKDMIQMRNFIEPYGHLPEDLIEKGFVGRSYDMHCLTSETGVNQIVQDIIDAAMDNSWPLELKKRLAEGTQQ